MRTILMWGLSMSIRLAALISVAALSVGSTAHATPLDFNYLGLDGTTISFDLDSNPTPTSGFNGFFFGDSTNVTINGDTSNELLQFYNISAGGGLTVFEPNDGYLSFKGAQLYTGSEAAPMFSDEVVPLFYELETDAAPVRRAPVIDADLPPGYVLAGTLTVSGGAVSAAPEPGTWAQMFAGLAMIGGMLRIANARRRENEVAGIATA